MATKKAAKKVARKKAAKKTAKKAARKASTSAEIENEKICGILQYVFPVGQIWYLADENMKKSAFAKFHLKQSLVLILLYVAIHIVLSILSFLYVIGWLLWLGWFVLWIIGLIAAIQGKKKVIPIVGQLASQFKF